MIYNKHAARIALAVALGLSACVAHGAGVATYLEDAKKYQQQGEYRAAVIQLKNALQQEPDNREARLLLGEIYVLGGDGPSAEKELERAKRLGAKPDRVLPLLGRAYLLQGEFKKVLEEVKAGGGASGALKAELLALQGNAYLGLGDAAEAGKRYDQALALVADLREASLGKIRVTLAQNKLDEARQLAEAATQRYANSADAWLLKGEVARRSIDHAGAAESFKRATDIEPENFGAHTGRALMLLALNEFDGAKASVDAAAKLAPQHPIVNYLRGLLAFQRGKVDEANDALQQVVVVAPNHMPSMLLLGAIHYSKGELEQAATRLSKFLGAFPEYGPARKLYAATQLKLRKPEKAIELLDVFVDKEPDDAQLLSLLGSAYMQKGDYAKGVDFLERAAKTAPDVAALHTQLALGYLASGESDEAVSQLKTAVDLGQGLVQADMLLVMTQLQRSEFDAALGSARKLAEKMPKNPVPYNLMAGAYLGKNDTKNARQQFEQALKIDPAFSTAHVNLARLDEAAGQREDARAHFETILVHDQKNAVAMLALARLAAEDGQPDQALRWLENAREKNPKAMQPALALIKYQLGRGEAMKALTVARDLESRNPDHPAVLEVLGTTQLATGQASSAVGTFRKLVERVPDSAPAHYRLASAQFAAGSMQDARASLKKTLELAPDSVPPQVDLALMDARAGETQEAMAAAAALQKQHPKSGVGWRLEGDIQALTKKPAEAALAYQKAQELEPSAVGALAVFRAKYAAGEKDGANRYAEAWLAKQPGDLATRLLLAEGYQNGSQNAKAIGHYQEVLKAQPDNIMALNNLAWVYQLEGDKKGLEFAERAYRLKPETPEVVDTYGWLLIHHGDAQRAVTLLQEAAMRAPHLPEIRYHLAVGLEKVGRRDEARKALKRLVDSREEFAERQAAQGLLNQLE